MIQVLKEPIAHDIGGGLWEDAALFLLPPVPIVVVLALGAVAAAHGGVAEEGAYLRD